MGGTHRLLMGSQWEDKIVAKVVAKVAKVVAKACARRHLSCPSGIPGRFAFGKILVTLFAVRVLLDPPAGGRRR